MKPLSNNKNQHSYYLITINIFSFKNILVTNLFTLQFIPPSHPLLFSTLYPTIIP